MHFGLARLISNLHVSDAFELSPSAGAKLLLQSHDLMDASADSDGLGLVDVADDLEVHHLSIYRFAANRKGKRWTGNIQPGCRFTGNSFVKNQQWQEG
jgi:hypothetical protein